MSDHLLVERTGPILRVTFNRPEKRNSMTDGMYDGLVAACDLAEADEDVRVMLLTGAGKQAFVAGPTSHSFSVSPQGTMALPTRSASPGRSAG